MDAAAVWTIVGSVAGVLGICGGTLGLVYGFLRNFKHDIKSDIDRLEKRQEVLDHRLFELVMGKSIKEILEEEATPKSEAHTGA